MRDLTQNVGNVLTIQHQTCVDEIFKCTIFVEYGGVIFFTGVPPLIIVSVTSGFLLSFSTESKRMIDLRDIKQVLAFHKAGQSLAKAMCFLRAGQA